MANSTIIDKLGTLLEKSLWSALFPQMISNLKG